MGQITIYLDFETEKKWNLFFLFHRDLKTNRFLCIIQNSYLNSVI
jgi:hypothetical protein